MVKRQKELELRRALREIRDGDRPLPGRTRERFPGMRGTSGPQRDERGGLPGGARAARTRGSTSGDAERAQDQVPAPAPARSDHRQARVGHALEPRRARTRCSATGSTSSTCARRATRSASTARGTPNGERLRTSERARRATDAQPSGLHPDRAAGRGRDHRHPRRRRRRPVPARRSARRKEAVLKENLFTHAHGDQPVLRRQGQLSRRTWRRSSRTATCATMPDRPDHAAAATRWVDELAELDDSDISTEPGIADVHSGAAGTGLDGTRVLGLVRPEARGRRETDNGGTHETDAGSGRCDRAAWPLGSCGCESTDLTRRPDGDADAERQSGDGDHRRRRAGATTAQTRSTAQVLDADGLRDRGRGGDVLARGRAATTSASAAVHARCRLRGRTPNAPVDDRRSLTLDLPRTRRASTVTAASGSLSQSVTDHEVRSAPVNTPPSAVLAVDPASGAGQRRPGHARRHGRPRPRRDDHLLPVDDRLEPERQRPSVRRRDRPSR